MIGEQVARRKIKIWWRDDDAGQFTDSLKHLLEVQKKLKVPITLSVIPDRLTGETIRLISCAENVSVALRGFKHISYYQEFKSEFHGREIGDALKDLEQGRKILLDAFGDIFIPVLVPPWNTVPCALAERLDEIGIVALSTYKNKHHGFPRLANVHVDFQIWTRGMAILRKSSDVISDFDSEINAREVGSSEPIGVITHHRPIADHEWGLVESTFREICMYENTNWTSLRDLVL